jgi:hypothetical protein
MEQDQDLDPLDQVAD